MTPSKNRDLELAQFQGTVLEKLENIEKKIESYGNDIGDLKMFRDRQKAYYVAAMAIGSGIIWVVNFLIDLYYKNK